MRVQVTQQQIDAVLTACAVADDEGKSRYPGKTYEDGVRAAINWLTDGDDSPFED